MESKTKNKKQKRMNKETKKPERMTDSETDAELEVIESQPRVMLTPVKQHKRSSSTSSETTDEGTRPKTSGKSKKKCIPEVEHGNTSCPGGALFEAVASERKELEKFLFDETNKVNRPAIKFILEKWSALESRLQSALAENEVLKEKCKNADKPQNKAVTYAQAAATRRQQQRPIGSEEPKKTEKYEVLLIKPAREDKRSNDQIKTEVLKKLDKVRQTLKVRSVRQMRKQGLVVEVQGNKDVEAIKSCDLNKLGLVVERPKKLNPSVIIYDVEKDYKAEELKEELIRKNFDNVPESELEHLKESIRFVHPFKVKNGTRHNWIVQLPAKLFASLISAGRAFLMWRTYRTSEYVNITRCFKCHGYGHIAKVCNIPEQLCGGCGQNDHLRKDCAKKEEPQCINCKRARRKDISHDTYNKDCPEYRRYLELYNSRIKWD